MSCPFIKFDYNAMCEKCKVTDKPTQGAVKCDFGYDEECAAYSAWQDKSSKRERKCQKQY